MLAIIVMGSIMNSNAQLDKFFSYRDDYPEDDEWCNLVLLPKAHGLEYNYPADDVPLGAGLLILSGLSIAYINIRKRK